MCVEYKERKKGEHDASQNHETARWAHVHGKVHARAQERERERESARILALRSPSVLVLPIITQSFPNCQIGLSEGHLFNKYCLVHYNEMDRMRASVCPFALSGRDIFENYHFIRDCWNETI